MIGSGTFAQSEAPEGTADRKDHRTDWSIFIEEPPKVTQRTCWLGSAPLSTKNTRDGAEVQVNRGDIAIFVLYVPGENKRGEVSFASGYPFAPNSEAELQIGSARYALLANGDTAFSADEETDAKIINSMKKGAQAVVTARSARGTDTEDTFSLTGFTAAFEKIESLCGA